MIFDAIEVFVRYGFSWVAVGVLLVRNRRLRKYINLHLPKILRDNTDSDLAEIKRDVKEIKEHIGVKSSGPIETLSNTEARSYRRLSLLLQMVKNQKNRRKKKMKLYLAKLGSRKFQAFLAVTIPNLIIMFGFVFGGIDLEGVVNQWMPAINLVIQAITTAAYQSAESKVDVAHAKGANTNDQLIIPIEPTE